MMKNLNIPHINVINSISALNLCKSGYKKYNHAHSDQRFLSLRAQRDFLAAVVRRRSYEPNLWLSVPFDRSSSCVMACYTCI